MIDAAKGTFSWRSVQSRPKIEVEIRAVEYDYWRLFAPYHYLSATLHRGARCYVGFIDDAPVVVCGVLHQPHPKVRDILRVSRIVTLPDWQGIGLSFVMTDTLGAMYKTAGRRFRNYPAHPSYIRSIDRSPNWRLIRKPGYVGRSGYGAGPTSTMSTKWRQDARPCAIFEYVGPAWEPRAEALELFNQVYKKSLT